MMDILVTYDIRTPDREGERRLARVAAVCERYGVRVQYSVFECRLDGILLERFKTELLHEIDSRVDSVNFYKLGVSFDSAREAIGTSGLNWRKPWII